MQYVWFILIAWLLGLEAVQSQSCTNVGDDQNWRKELVGVGQNGRLIMASVSGKAGVYCLAQDQQISKWGGISSNSLLMLWNGKTWLSIAPSLTFTGSAPKFISLENIQDSLLVLTGVFNVSNLNSPGIIMFNLHTKQWQPIGQGVVSGFIYRTRCWQDTLYVLGNFTQLRDSIKVTQANYVGRYILKTGRWDSLGTGLGGFIPNIDGNVNYQTYAQIEIGPENEVFFCGRFSSAGGISTAGIAGWKSGRGWRNLNGGPRAYNGSNLLTPNVYTMHYSPKDTAMFITGYVGWMLNAPANRTRMLGVGRFVDSAWTQKQETSWNYDSAWNFQFVNPYYGITYASVFDTTANRIYYAGMGSNASFANAYFLDLNNKTIQLPNKGINSAANVRALTKWDGKIFAFGSITEVDSALRCDNAAYFENQTWHTIGRGLSTANSSKSVDAFTTLPTGHLLVGGEFEYLSGKFCRSLALIDSNWNVYPFNNGLFTNSNAGNLRQVRSLLTWHDTLLIAGQFGGGGTQSSLGIIGYQLSNNTWFKLGNSGLNSGAYLNHVIKCGNRVVAGGYFSQIDGNNFSNLAWWNGTSWNSLGDPNATVKQLFNIGDTAILVFGTFTSINGTSRNRIAIYHFNTNQWISVGQAGLPSSTDHISFNPINGEIWCDARSNIAQFPQKSSSSFAANGYAVFKDSLWQHYGNMAGNGSNPVHLYHDDVGTTFLNGIFNKIGVDSFVNSARYSVSNQWSGSGKNGGVKSDATFSQPVVRAAINWRNHLVLAGVFEYTNQNQASHHLAAYNLLSNHDNQIAVKLNADTTVWYGVTLNSVVTGSYDSIQWNNKSRNQLYLNVDTSGIYTVRVFNKGCSAIDSATIVVRGQSFYKGGIGDGAQFLYTQPSAFVAGGSGDGSSQLNTINAQILKGGGGDGAAVNKTTNVSLMPGGNGDGAANRQYLSKALMTGGLGDASSFSQTVYKQQMPGGGGDGFAYQSYLPSPDGVINSIVMPLKLSETDSTQLKATVYNIGAAPIKGFEVYWLLNGSLFEVSRFNQDSIWPGDSIRVFGNRNFLPNRAGAPWQACAVVKHIANETDSSNNTLCAILDVNLQINEPSFASQQQIKVWPNPSNAEVYLCFDGFEQDEPLQYSLYSPEGKLITTEQLHYQNQTLSIQMSSLPPGIYLLSGKLGECKFQFKVVKF